MRADLRGSSEGVTAPHGTRSRYVNHKCRCQACTAANRDYQRGHYRFKLASQRGRFKQGGWTEDQVRRPPGSVG